MCDPEPRVLSVFCCALECGSALEREACLAQACGGDLALRARVEALLRAHDRAGNFLRGSSEPTRPN
jgi:hypothetical protein